MSIAHLPKDILFHHNNRRYYGNTGADYCFSYSRMHWNDTSLFSSTSFWLRNEIRLKAFEITSSEQPNFFIFFAPNISPSPITFLIKTSLLV